MTEFRGQPASQLAELPPIKWTELLASVPPGRERATLLLSEKWGENHWTMATTSFQLFCDSLTCSRESYFDFMGAAPTPVYNQWTPLFLWYRCRHCKQTEKLFAVLVRVVKLQAGVRERAIKLGEVPAFGPDSSMRLNPLLELARESFINGLRAEAQALGFGAFTYYHRVVEALTPTLISEIVKIWQQVGMDPQTARDFELAKQETQFSRAVEKMNGRIPNNLRMGEHNPLTLLQSALDEGPHAPTDAKGLELAVSIRIVLTELTDRISRALKDHTEITVAVNRLAHAKPPPPSPSPPRQFQ